jgi:hypothetical protein
MEIGPRKGNDEIPCTFSFHSTRMTNTYIGTFIEDVLNQENVKFELRDPNIKQE